MAKKNWDKVKSQQPSDSTKYRDVYEDQQLERSKIEEKQSPASRIILTTVLAILIFAALYFFISVGQYAAASIKSSFGGIMSQDENTAESVPDAETLPHGTYKRNGKFYYDYPENNPWAYCDEEGNIIYELPEETQAETEPAETDASAAAATEAEEESGGIAAGLKKYMRPSLGKILVSAIVALIFWVIMYQVMMKQLKAQNMLSDTSDINQYQNDQHVALPEEIQRKFDWFPDVGAHSNVQVSSMISHVALTNKGINAIDVARRADKDILDEDGDIEYYKGEVLLDDDGKPLTKKMSMIDEKFMDALFTASGSPEDKAFRKYYDTTKIPYNPGGKDRTKQGGKWDTVAELINHDWVFPDYEPQRPAGAYLVDTEPVNTMV